MFLNGKKEIIFGPFTEFREGAEKDSLIMTINAWEENVHTYDFA